MLNVSALVLDDALLKCVVTIVVLFSTVAFKTLTFQRGTVATLLKCGRIFTDSTVTNFLLILAVKKFENCQYLTK